MDYKALPISERVNKAAEYCLLLLEDEQKPLIKADAIKELQSTFSLTESQAHEAYDLMKEKYSAEYKNSIKKKIKFAWIILFASVVCTFFYTVIGTGIGWVFYLIAGFFGVAVIGIFLNLGNLYTLKSPLLQKYFANSLGSNLNSKKNDIARIPVFFFFMSLVTFILMFVHPRAIDPKELVRLNKLVIVQKVIYANTGGRSPTYYYSFYFKNHKNEFRLEDNIYKYGKWSIGLGDFMVGDTLSVQIKKKYANRLFGSEDRVYIVNLLKSGSWLIDYNDRNEKIKEEDKKTFYIFGAGFLLSCIGTLIWIRLKN
jgi:hypothetical protein